MMKILVVDNEIEVINLLLEFLRRNKYPTEKAMNCKETLEQIEKFHPDIVLLDIYLPDGGGVGLLKIIKQKYPDIIVIMVTGLIDKEIGLQSLELGAADYITKPIDLNYLETSVLAKAISSFREEK